MDQKEANKLSSTMLTSGTKTLLFEVVRAKNAVLSRVPGNEFYGTYTIYNSNPEYIETFTKFMNKDGFWVKEIYKETKKNFVVLEINWKSEHVELPAGI